MPSLRPHPPQRPRLAAAAGARIWVAVAGLVTVGGSGLACSPRTYLLGDDPRGGGAAGAPGATDAGGGAGGATAAPLWPARIDISRGGPGARALLGDLTGDGRLDLLSVQGDSGFDDGEVPHEVVALTAFDLTGAVLWTVGEVDPAGQDGGNDPPAQIYDLDGDGHNEVVTVMADRLVVLDGRTGETELSHELPDPDAHDAILIANLTGNARPADLILKDRFSRIWAFDRDFSLLFTHEGQIGYAMWAYDWDGDGHDELMAGCDFLDHDGTLLWSACEALDGTPDAIYAGDLDGEPSNGVELILGGGNTLAYRADGTQLWLFDSVEAQNIALGDFDPQRAGLEVAGLDRVNRTREEGRDATFLLGADGGPLFHHERAPGSGWLTILAAFTNWEGEGRDWIVTYRRGPELPPALLDGDGEVVLTFGEDPALVFPVDLCGDARTELLYYTDRYVDLLDHGDCDLAAAITGSPRPQSKRLYSRSRGLSGEYPYE